MSERIYLLTGVAGFLGSNICLQLLEKGCKIRALVLPNDKSAKYIPKDVEVVIGDLCDEASLDPFFTVPEGDTSVIIHCASMVTVDPTFSDKLMEVNVTGTRNIITKALAHPECEKMVYVSSTGAIPEQPHGTPITEVSKFTPVDNRKVVDAYSLSKAIATQMVMDSVKVMGLKACVVHPSGILGPYDHALGETTRTVLQIIKGEMPMGTSQTQGLTYIEAAANGLPLLCRQDDCLKDVIRQGANGFEYTYEQDFLDALSVILDDPGWRISAGKRSEEIASNFDKAVFGNVVEEVYEFVLMGQARK